MAIPVLVQDQCVDEIIGNLFLFYQDVNLTLGFNLHTSRGKEKSEDTKGVNKKSTDITMAKRKRTKWTNMNYDILHRKLKIEQYEPH